MVSVLDKYKEPFAFEDPYDLRRRKALVDDFLKEYLRSNPLENGKKYGVVCHSMMIATLTSTGINLEDKKGLKDYIWCANC